jgi:hypothetical protein
MGFGDWAEAAARAFSSYERGNVDMGAPRRVMDQLGQWMGHLSRNATIHWGPSLIDPVDCSFCDEDAVTDCIVCGDAVCLAHSHISHRAEAICDECVEFASRAKEKKEKKHKKQRRRAAPPPGNASDSQVAQALAILGLSPGASWEDVQGAYRAAARANHPDRFQGTQREQAEGRLKNINAAFNVLKAHYSKRAA